MSSSGIKREVDRRTFFYCCICFTFSPRAIRVCWFVRYFFLSWSPKYFCLCFPYSIWRSLFFFSFSFHDLFRFIFQYRFFLCIFYFLFFTFPPVYLFSHTLVLFALSLFLLLFRSFFGLVFSCLSLWPLPLTCTAEARGQSRSCSPVRKDRVLLLRLNDLRNSGRGGGGDDRFVFSVFPRLF